MVNNAVMVMARLSRILLLIAGGLAQSSACGQISYESQRHAMIEELRDESRLSEEYGAPPISERTLAALGQVPRHEFVPDSQKRYAYQNRPLSIGTGSGYQAAVLSELAGRVYTIEIVEMLGRRATNTLERLGYNNVTARVGDGYAGWPDQAPFDAILVTAAPEEIPEPLIEQLAVGGRMVIPVRFVPLMRDEN